MKHNTLKSISDVEAFRKALGIHDLHHFDDQIAAFNALLKLYHRSGGDSKSAVDGFLKSAAGHVDSEFLKTFQSNSAGISDVLNLTGGSALQIQSLDQSLISLVQSRDDYRFLNTCKFEDAFSTFLEYNRLLAHQSSNRPSAWVQESSDPHFDDPIIERVAHNIAFLSHGYSQSRVLPQVRTTQDPEAILQESAMHAILRTLAWGVWYGNREINEVEFNGFIKELEDAGQVLDAEGSFPDLHTLKGITEQIRYPGYGVPNQLWMGLPVKRSWDNLLISQGVHRAYLTQNGQGGPLPGFDLPGFMDANAANNQIRFEEDLYMDRYQETVPMVYNRSTGKLVEGASGANPPGAPSIAATAVTEVLGSKWKTGDVNTKKVAYRVSAGSHDGRSTAAASTQSDAAIEAGGAVNLKIRPDSSGPSPSFYEIFRETAPGNGTFRLLTRIKAAAGGATTWQDINAWRPGTAEAIIGDFNSRSASESRKTYSIAQLLPAMLTKYPPGVIALRKLGGMVELYAGLRIFAPKKFYLIKNLPAQV